MKSTLSKIMVAMVAIVSLNSTVQANSTIRAGMADTTKKSKMKADKMKPAKMDKMKTAKDTGKMSKMSKM